ncbi:MAG: type III pantothenate kinase [Pseudomonadota bacterium]
MFLLVDIGNTRVKWAWYTQVEGLSHQGKIKHRGVVGELNVRFDAIIDRINSRPERVLLANVAGKQLQNRFVRWCADAGVPLDIVRVAQDRFGIRLAYADPAALGVDRWLAMVAAKQRNRKPFLVVDAGTAVTLDAVDSDGTHLGGCISPGVPLMQETLLKKTADIRHAEAHTVQLFASGTGDAVAAGAWFSVAALADRGVQELEKRVGVKPKVFITGGDGERVADLMYSKCRFDPDLVLRGLAVCVKVPLV